jgi:predicted ester cyclase
MVTAFPDLTVGVSRNFQKGDTVISEWVMTGTNNGDFMGKKATKKKIGIHAVTIFVFTDDGLVKEARPYFDDGTLMMQLGLAPGKREIATLPSGDTKWITASGSADEQKAVDTWKASWPASWSKRDVKMYESQIADDCVHVDYARGTEVKGKKANVGELEMFMKAMPEIKVDVSNAWAFGNVVVSEWVFSGTLKGSIGPLKANGKPVTAHGLDIDELQGDKLSKGYSYSNSMELMGELGMLPKQK